MKQPTVQEKWDEYLEATRVHGIGSPEAKRAQTAYRRALAAARRRREAQRDA